ncbi:octopine ABC transporter [Nitratireductor aquibiodomus RA22]|uniref:Octopine ABC transporter n=1 Tax=Nitratireductor aquibiodomus RA22 TaxID=1189611 RepID=I5C580_9HYPH|nr:ABC transporter permease [Nitratireductor aquibiodomus]EIM76982.1 octopine ABC transporter [Nitratireductor aquibiodomus RA22]
MRWDVYAKAIPELISAVPVTLHLAVVALLAGFCLAVLIAAARLSGMRLLSGVAYGYVYVIRGTPLLVQIFFLYYGVGQFEAVRLSPFWPVLREAYWCALIALSLNTAAYGSEIIRGGLLAVPAGQIEAAKAFGLSSMKRFRLVVFPQAVRVMLPAYGNELILLIKATSLASTITIIELTGQARTLASETYAPVEVFISAGAIYLALNGLSTLSLQAIEARLKRRGGLAMQG